MLRTPLLLGSTLAFLGVGLGAFGAHALRARLAPEMLAVYQTGVQYQMLHALGLILIAALADRLDAAPLVRLAYTLMAAGVALFSGSLYALALSGLRLLGVITPLGGLCFLSAWFLLLLAAYRQGAGPSEGARRPAG